MDDDGFESWVTEARNSGRAFDLAAYRELLVPSERVPAMHFASIDPDLYRRILERCVEPGTPCIGDTMRHAGHAAESQGDPSP